MITQIKNKRILIGIIAFLIIISPFLFEVCEIWKIRVFDLGLLRGVNSKEEVVQRYIEAIQKRNPKLIEKLTPSSYNTKEAIKEKLNKLQGADFNESKILYSNEFFPIKIVIQNIRLSNGQVVSDEIYIEKDCQLYPGILTCKKWYLLIGRLKNAYHPIPFRGFINKSLPASIVGEIEIPRRDISLSANIIHPSSSVKGIKIVAIEKNTKILLANGKIGSLRDLMDLPSGVKIKAEGKISLNKNVLLAKKITVLKE